MNYKLLPIPKSLQSFVECIRIVEYSGEGHLAIHVALNGLPGIVFQHHEGESPINNITTPSGVVVGAPTLYVYGLMTQPGIMNHKAMPFTTTQIVLKPHALHSLLSINASVLTNAMVDLAEFSAGDLNQHLLEAGNEQERMALLAGFLSAQSEKVKMRDRLVEESLYLIHQNASSITVKALLNCLNISERQFEKRFSQTVGLTPHFYIRVKRFNEAIRLMKSGRFERLTDVAYALNFYDQSHFIRDIKAFSGMTPKDLFQRVDEFQPDERVYAFV